MSNALLKAKSQIINYLNQSLLATVNILSDGKPKSIMTVFGNDKDGCIYICVRKHSSIVKMLHLNPDVSLLISREEDILEDISALTVEGKAEIIDAVNSESNMIAYDILNKKSPVIGKIPDSDQISEYRIIKIQPAEIIFQNYGKYLDKIQPVILKKKP